MTSSDAPSPSALSSIFTSNSRAFTMIQPTVSSGMVSMGVSPGVCLTPVLSRAGLRPVHPFLRRAPCGALIARKREGEMADARTKAERLFGRVPAIGCWLDLPSPEAAEIAALAGADFGLVDLEHGAISIETALRMIAALRAGGAAPLARPPEATDAWAKRLLDAGAAGLIMPMIESAEAAAAAAAAMRYPPLGRRGAAAGVIAASRWGRDPVYVAGWNEACFLAVQIESPTAVEAAAAMAAVDGVDMLFFGPNDYAYAAGLDGPDDPAVWPVLEKMVETAHAAGKLVGTVAFGRGAAALVAAGCDLVSAASDVAALGRGIAADVAAARP
ncbi:MAG: hypothetical protein EA355_14030 [Rhodobacteraceae bacterium]|nr:MAG: hypothetical protein EA355_14030 [Paracoccaceae bacterium]